MAAGLRPARLRTPGVPAAARPVDQEAAGSKAGARGGRRARYELQRRGDSAARTAAAAGARSGRRRRERGGGNVCEGGAHAAGSQGQPGHSPCRHLLARPTANQRRPRPEARAEAERGRERSAQREGSACSRLRRGRGCLPGGLLRRSPCARAACAGRGGAQREAGLGPRAPGTWPRASGWTLPRRPVRCWSRDPRVPRRDLRSFLALK